MRRRSLLMLFAHVCVAAVITISVILSAAVMERPCLGSVPESQKAAIMVTGYQIYPEVLMRNDIGTVTVTVTNTESARSVHIKNIQMLSRDLKVLSDPYFNIGRLGPGESLTVTFSLKASCTDGVHYLRVLVEGENAQNVRYSFPVIVDSSPLTIGVMDFPEDIFTDEQTRIRLVVGNPRRNTVTGVRIISEDACVIPTEVFVGALSADESEAADFNFTPHREGNHTLNFRLVFKNGDNSHSTDLSVPLNVTSDRKNVELVITGIEVEPLAEPGAYKITGDINNAGLKEAKGVVVKVGESGDVEAMYPYKSYFVGLLNTDDFGSFELNAKINENVTQVPVVIEYKDESGNLFSRTEYITIENSELTESVSGELPASIIALLVVVVVSVIAAITYSWKRR